MLNKKTEKINELNQRWLDLVTLVATKGAATKEETKEMEKIRMQVEQLRREKNAMQFAQMMQV